MRFFKNKLMSNLMSYDLYPNSYGKLYLYLKFSKCVYLDF